jgi:hypothetical protein
MRISYGLFTATKINPGQSKLPGLLQVLPQLWALVIRAASGCRGTGDAARIGPLFLYLRYAPPSTM